MGKLEGSKVTEEERKMLYETHERMREIHSAFFGSMKDGQPTAYERIMTVVVFAERSSWGVKITVRLILTIGALTAAIAGAWATIRGVIPR